MCGASEQPGVKLSQIILATTGWHPTLSSTVTEIHWAQWQLLIGPRHNTSSSIHHQRSTYYRQLRSHPQICAMEVPIKPKMACEGYCGESLLSPPIIVVSWTSPLWPDLIQQRDTHIYTHLQPSWRRYNSV